jgi:thiamine pyrophosphate-dependent acetolactate synthase large subunit-like protein
VATHGFALPAAIAAALARDDARVVAIGGAAGLAAMAGEWRTTAQLSVPIVAVALNEAGATDVSRATRTAGVEVFSARDEQSFAALFERAWRAHTPTLIDVHVSR